MIKLYLLESTLKKFLIAFIFVLSLGVLVGLAYLYNTTNYSTKETITRFNGSQEESLSEMDIPENYPRPVSELLITTHNHVISFSLIFAALGIVFYFNSIIEGFWKKFLMIEPFVSTIFSFGGIWLMRFVHESFIYMTVISSTILYLSFFVMSIVILSELLFKKVKV